MEIEATFVGKVSSPNRIAITIIRGKGFEDKRIAPMTTFGDIRFDDNITISNYGVFISRENRLYKWKWLEKSVDYLIGEV